MSAGCAQAIAQVITEMKKFQEKKDIPSYIIPKTFKYIELLLYWDIVYTSVKIMTHIMFKLENKTFSCSYKII